VPKEAFLLRLAHLAILDGLEGVDPLAGFVELILQEHIFQRELTRGSEG
jgi:hypothetical protein